MKVTVIDQIGNSANRTVPVEKVADVLNGWFTDPPYRDRHRDRPPAGPPPRR